MPLPKLRFETEVKGAGNGEGSLHVAESQGGRGRQSEDVGVRFLIAILRDEVPGGRKRTYAEARNRSDY